MDTRSLEDFALAEDRAQALEAFVPGTDDHFYLRSLQLQEAGQLAEVDKLLDEWRSRIGTTTRCRQIEQRQERC